MGLCKDGYWRETERYEGKKYVGSGRSQKEALKNLAKKIADAKAGKGTIDKNTTVTSWSSTWLDVYIKPKVREPGQPKSSNSMTQKSYEMYVQKLDGYILPLIGHLRLKDVRDVHLQRVLNEQSGKSKSHAEKIRIVIKALFRQAFQSRLIQYDPSSGLDLPATTEGKRRGLTNQERELLLRTCEFHRCGLWIKTLLDTGLRPGESAPLLIKDFDFNSKLLSIDKDIESGTYSVSDPKTKSGIRKVPLPDDLIPELKAAFSGRSPFEYAFPQLDGKSMKSSTCITNDWRSFRRCMDIIGGAKTTWRGNVRTISTDGYDATNHGRIMTMKEDGVIGSVIADDLILYSLRHTYCTDLQKAGIPINIASYLMGHADIQTTANIYTHTGEDDAISAAISINQYRNKKTDTSKTLVKMVVKK